MVPAAAVAFNDIPLTLRGQRATSKKIAWTKSHRRKIRSKLSKRTGDKADFTQRSAAEGGCGQQPCGPPQDGGPLSGRAAPPESHRRVPRGCVAVLHPPPIAGERQ